MRLILVTYFSLLMLLSGCLSVDELVPEGAPPEPFSEEALNFLVVGDWGRRGWFNQSSVGRRMGIVAEEIGSDFVISTGDNFYTNGIESADDSEFRTSFENVYEAPSLMKPWFITLGNHDYQGSVKAQIDYSERSERWMLPGRYYAVTQAINDSSEALFAFLDTTPIAEVEPNLKKYPASHLWEPEVQLAWLDSTLSASNADWKIVVGHHPLYSAARKQGDSPVMIEQLLPLLEEHGVLAYFSGHAHSLQHLKPESTFVNFFISGAGSMTRGVRDHPHALYAVRTPGFMAVSLLPDRMHVQFIDKRGRLRYAATLRPEPAPSEPGTKVDTVTVDAVPGS